MDLGELFGPVDLRAENRWEAIEELIDYLVSIRAIEAGHRDEIVASVKARESTMSTGIGFGIGIPDASTPLVPDVVGVFGRSRKGIQFDALDCQPVHRVVLYLVPQGQIQKHINTLARVAKMLRGTPDDLL